MLSNKRDREPILEIDWQEPRISKISEVPEKSRYQAYLRGLFELERLGANHTLIKKYRYTAAQNCFLTFCEIMKKGDLEVVGFHEIIAAAFEDLFDRKYRRLIISCPPRSGKSMLGTLLLCWLLGKDHRCQNIVASYGEKLSLKFFKDAMAFLKMKEFSEIFPTWGGFHAGTRYDLKDGGQILATSVGGSLTGFTSGTPDIHSPGLGVMMIDDPLKGSDSAAALEALETWWIEQASTRRTNSYAQILIGTRFHECDLHGVLMKNDGIYDPVENPHGWRWLNFEGLCENPDLDPLERQIGESHWPENPTFSVDVLMSQRNAGERIFNAMYQGRPTTEGGQIIKAQWITTIPEELLPEMNFTWLGIDTGFEEKESADFSAITVCGCSKYEPNKMFVIDIIQGKWGFPELLAQLKIVRDKYKPKVLAIEKAASGHSLIQMLEKEKGIKVIPMKPIRSKTVRLETVAPLMAAGKVVIAENENWTPDTCHELTQFPYVAKKDRVDSFAWGLMYYGIHMDRDRTLFGGNLPSGFSRAEVSRRFKAQEEDVMKYIGSTPGQNRRLSTEKGRIRRRSRGIPSFR